MQILKLIIVALVGGFLSGGILPAAAADAPIRPSLQEITAQQTTDSTTITIKTDRPAPWTHYIMPQLWKGVVDLTNVDPGRVQPERTLSGGVARRIVVKSREINEQPVTRIVIDLATEVEMAVNADPADKSKLIVTLKKGKFSVAEKPAPAPIAAPSPPPVAVPRPAPAAEQKPVTTLQPVVASLANATTLTSVTINGDTLEVQADGRLHNARVFGIKKPNRLVLDLGKLRNSSGKLPEMPKQSGIRAVRIGTFEGNLRLVLDYGTGQLPAYQLDKTATGLTLRLR